MMHCDHAGRKRHLVVADAFGYSYRRLGGDGEIVARVVALVSPHEWSKIGVMIRESLRRNHRTRSP